MMTWWQALILGLVEGVTEYLPVSSTGHLIIASRLIGLEDEGPTGGAVDAFNIVVQGGAILAVLGLYWPRVVRMLRGVVGRDRAGLRLLINLVVAFVPAAALGPLLDEAIEGALFRPAPVVLALALGGVFMIAVDRAVVRPRRLAEAAGRPVGGSGGAGGGGAGGGGAGAGVGDGVGGEIEGLGLRAALLIGLMQCVAMVPGTSRSMMTIVGGVLVGLRPRAAAEFSFLLGLPTLGAACAYKLYKNVTAEGPGGEPAANLFEVLGAANVAIGVAVAAGSAALAVRWLVGFLNRHGLEAFGWYRIVVAGALAVVFFG